MKKTQEIVKDINDNIINNKILTKEKKINDIQTLIEINSEYIDFQDQAIDDILLFAINNELTSLLAYLFEQGVDANRYITQQVTNENGEISNTKLHILIHALKTENQNIIELLLRNGADIDANIEGSIFSRTPADFAENTCQKTFDIAKNNKFVQYNSGSSKYSNVDELVKLYNLSQKTRDVISSIFENKNITLEDKAVLNHTITKNYEQTLTNNSLLRFFKYSWKRFIETPFVNLVAKLFGCYSKVNDIQEVSELEKVNAKSYSPFAETRVLNRLQDKISDDKNLFTARLAKAQDGKINLEKSI